MPRQEPTRPASGRHPETRPPAGRQQDGRHRVVVPFEDNRLLGQLLGEYDGHLALIEERLGADSDLTDHKIQWTRVRKGALAIAVPKESEVKFTRLRIKLLR